jgi:hypothetical protein
MDMDDWQQLETSRASQSSPMKVKASLIAAIPDPILPVVPVVRGTTADIPIIHREWRRYCLERNISPSSPTLKFEHWHYHTNNAIVAQLFPSYEDFLAAQDAWMSNRLAQRQHARDQARERSRTRERRLM